MVFFSPTYNKNNIQLHWKIKSVVFFSSFYMLVGIHSWTYQTTLKKDFWNWWQKLIYKLGYMVSLSFQINSKNSSIYKVTLQNHFKIIFLLCCNLTFNHATTKIHVLKCHCGLRGCSIRASCPPWTPFQIFHKLKEKSLRIRPTECDPRPREYNPHSFSKLYRIKEFMCTCLPTEKQQILETTAFIFFLATSISNIILNQLLKDKKREKEKKRRNQTLVEKYIRIFVCKNIFRTLFI